MPETRVKQVQDSVFLRPNRGQLANHLSTCLTAFEFCGSIYLEIVTTRTSYPLWHGVSLTAYLYVLSLIHYVDPIFNSSHRLRPYHLVESYQSRASSGTDSGTRLILPFPTNHWDRARPWPR